MRRRLLISTLTVALVAVAILGIPASIAGLRLIDDEARRTVDDVASRISRFVDARLAEGLDVSAQTLALQLGDDLHVLVRLPDGTTITAGSPEGPAAIRSSELTPRGATVTVTEAAEALSDQRRQLFVLVAGASAAALAVAAALGLVLARRLSEPLVELALAAERFGSGQARPPGVRTGIPEVDRVGEVLESSGRRIADTLAAERRFATEASHQLRTPLTALSMRLEEIAAADDLAAVRSESHVALDQVERLAGVVSELLARSRTARTGLTTEVDVDAVLRQQVLEWRPAFASRARTVRLDNPAPLRALASPGGLAQVVATLLENSLVHGAGQTTVGTRSRGSSVVVEVTDEGAGVPASLVGSLFERSVSGGSGTGLGLALARDLAEADGGRLALVAQQPAVFALFLAPATSGGTSSELEPGTMRGVRGTSRPRR